jgi:hypothetical protein
MNGYSNKFHCIINGNGNGNSIGLTMEMEGVEM